MAIPGVGELAPDFTLPGTLLRRGERTDDAYSLRAQIGRTVVLAFYPGDATPVCTAQMCSYERELDEFLELGAIVWGSVARDSTRTRRSPAGLRCRSRCSPTPRARSSVRTVSRPRASVSGARCS